MGSDAIEIHQSTNIRNDPLVHINHNIPQIFAEKVFLENLLNLLIKQKCRKSEKIAKVPIL